MQNNNINNEETKVHKRRVRYKGTHPRKFEEKYKELNPEKYKDTIFYKSGRDRKDWMQL